LSLVPAVFCYCKVDDMAMAIIEEMLQPDLNNLEHPPAE
jgi:hypothetical protein